MRTTLTIDDALLNDLKRRAAEEGVSFKELVNRALRAGLASLGQRKAPRRYRCPTFDLGVPRIDLSKALALAAALEDDEIVRKSELKK